MNDHGRVHIRYLRPPDRVQIFEQALVHDGGDVKVTLAEGVDYDPPIRIEGRIALERGSDVVWFTFPEVWHDIGRFHRADGTFTGFYANVLTPPRMDGAHWETTDLFLDVWMGADGTVLLLDEEEFEQALGREWIAPETAARVREEAEHLLRDARAGAWPPAVVREWTLERCREALGR